MKEVLIKIRDFYFNNLKKLMIIPLILIFLAVFSIALQYFTTGDFINRGVTLKGGVTVTIPSLEGVTSIQLEDFLAGNFPEKESSVRLLKVQGENRGFVVDSELQAEDEINKLKSLLEEEYGLTEEDIGIEVMGSALGESFFKETFKAIIISFLFMALVVFIYFRVPIPCFAVILCALCDIIETVALINILGVKLSTAGVAAFLMLIGYSVDTDMLLTARVLRRKEGLLIDRIVSAIKTGFMMNIIAIGAVTVGLLLAQSDVLKQIMLILLIGLIFDMINTWIQNAGLLKNYVEGKEKKHEQA
jgi:preprotein translocase subunit SecF